MGIGGLTLRVGWLQEALDTSFNLADARTRHRGGKKVAVQIPRVCRLGKDEHRACSKVKFKSSVVEPAHG